MKAKLNKLIERATALNNSSSLASEFKAWRTDVLRFLIKQYDEKSTEVESFGNLKFFNVYAALNGGNPSKQQERFQKDLQTAILYLKNYLADCEGETETERDRTKISLNDKAVFVVHGRDEGIKAQVSNFLLKMKLEPVILHEQANEGQTIIEKFEKHASVKAAIVLFTGDDVGKYKDAENYEKRARQNVIFEAGFFMGKLGRKNTIILAETGLAIQSDLAGFIYIPLDENKGWHGAVAKELKAIGFSIDMNDML
jgi:predicted nucleotide-binding protein